MSNGVDAPADAPAAAATHTSAAPVPPPPGAAPLDGVDASSGDDDDGRPSPTTPDYEEDDEAAYADAAGGVHGDGGITGEEEDEEDEEDVEVDLGGGHHYPQHDDGHGHPAYYDPAYANSQLAQPNSEVAMCLKRLARDEMDLFVIGEQSGWTPELIVRHVVPLLFKVRHLQEIVLVDLVSDTTLLAICAAIKENPTITALGLVVTENGHTEHLTMAGVEYLCELLACAPTLSTLFINNVLHRLIDEAAEVLARSLCHAPSLMQLNLECNSVHDGALLPIARAIATHRSISVLNLENNSIGYDGLEIMSEVMTYNRSLIQVKVDGNEVPRPLDTWEGFTIMEQCKVNKEMQRLGTYSRDMHLRWPRLFRRKCNRLWYVWSLLGERKPSEDSWENVLSFMDGRGYVNQKVRLWMKQQGP
eukprot:Rhum_TRINITY_DN23029_c0_g1::Rhum_TRINITY_DN23029_c0_g1_i1::g.176952::m.176952